MHYSDLFTRWPVLANNPAMLCCSVDEVQTKASGWSAMKPCAVFNVLVSILCISAAVAQEPVAREPYDVAEAYRIYSVLLPREQHYGLAKGTLVIGQETVSKVRLSDFEGSFPGGDGRFECLTKEAEEKFRDAYADYERVNTNRWLLQRQFQIEKPYDIVSSDTLRPLLNAPRGLDDFDKHYPSSGGYAFVMSAVGFNRDKTRAVVYFGSSCRGGCGTGSFHLVEKFHGSWKEVPGVICSEAW